MKKCFHCIFIIFLYTCFLFPYSITASPKKKNTKYVYTFINHPVLHLIKKPNVKHFFAPVTPTSINQNFSTYTYFLITCATKIKNSRNIPSLSPETTHPLENLHCFITPTQTNIENYKTHVPISEFLSPLPSIRKLSPDTYHLFSTRITDRKNFTAIPSFLHSRPEKAVNAASSIIRYCLNNNKNSHHLDLLLTLLSKKTEKNRSEDHPFPIPAPGIGKKLKEQCIALAISNEDPPLPILVPGIGKELKIREYISKSRMMDGHGVVPTLSDVHLISKELKAAGGYIFTPVTINAEEEDHPFPIPAPGIGKSGITSIFQYAFIPVNYSKKDIKLIRNNLLLYFY